jgi:putative ABC transport system permease protein
MAFAAAIFVVGTFSLDAIRFALDVQFSAAQTEDATIVLTQATPESAVTDVEHLPGVLRAEPMRVVGVTLRHGHRKWRTAITGLSRDAELRRLVDADRRAHPIPPEGIALGATIAGKLGVGVGDSVTVEPLEGDRTPRDVVVSQVIDEIIGGSVVMELSELHRFLEEDRVVTAALVALDRRDEAAFHRRVKHLPAVASVSMRRAQLQNFERMIEQNMGVMQSIQMVLASIIAFAVVYNNARVALAERSRELASLRVLGFSRREVARILLAEMLFATAASIPLGLLLGYGMAAAVVNSYATELLRIPLVIGSGTYALAALTVAVSAGLSALIVRRRIDHLDLVGVLKTRD